LEDEAQLMDAAPRLNGIQKDGVEKGDVLLPRFDSGTNGQVPQGIHDLGDIDIVWTSNTASVAGGADPDGLRRKHPFPMVVLDMTEDLIGEDIHGISHRASGGTLLALIAGLKFFPTVLNDFPEERVLFLIHCPF
jgi:hypothetical protein